MSVDVIEQVLAALERWGWVQRAVEDEDGLDLVGAFEAVCGADVRSATPEADLVLDRFLPKEVDAALRAVARVLGPVPDEGPLPDERWAWIHTITCFNDAPETTFGAVRNVLSTASGVLGSARR